ncbi:FAD/NAD-P-binding domain-containing protein [Vararia minispora EC-137]|uniref:FAD/NAD-P-binding domain-containing protein n=1 Tax=Vararia minispora EC-137 TaxID=1314806 RepID=A0ACB8QZJ3_9AGAM|nr:FAD/NAD-P-binding domain-containing protein [Vararia minispora EC-137]
MSSVKEKNVVIVGGGFGGATIARELSGKLDPSKYHITLVTLRPFMVNLTATIRLTTSELGVEEKKVIFPYDKLFHKKDVGTVKVGRVTAVEASEGSKPGCVVLEGGEKLSYNVLVLAPGFRWNGPVSLPYTEEETRAHIDSWREKFKTSKNIVVVGGGAVGIEFSGEIRDVYPDAKVTLIHRDRLLLNDFFPEKFRKAIEKDARAGGVDVVLNDSLEDLELKGTSVTLESGKKIDADLIIPAFGGKPATDFIASSLGADSLTDKGLVKVTKTLRLPAYTNIFAAGDIIDVQESKQVVPTYFHASVVAANVLAVLNDKEPKREYSKVPISMCVSNGRNRGLIYVDILWGIIFGNWVASFAKNFLFNLMPKNYGQ